MLSLHRSVTIEVRWSNEILCTIKCLNFSKWNFAVWMNFVDHIGYATVIPSIETVYLYLSHCRCRTFHGLAFCWAYRSSFTLLNHSPLDICFCIQNVNTSLSLLENEFAFSYMSALHTLYYFSYNSLFYSIWLNIVLHLVYS